MSLIGTKVSAYFTKGHRPDDHTWIVEDLSNEYENKLTKQPDIDVTAPTGEKKVFNVDPSKTYQMMRGIGISMEGTTVANLKELTDEARHAVLKQWFDPVDGCGYNWVRICCGTADFVGWDWYTYDDVEGDTALEHFSIEKDHEHLIPEFCREILEINPAVSFLMSPWSPPAWMKTNGDMCKGGHLKKECYEVCAQLYTKAVEAYLKEGIKVTEFTCNNETRYGPEMYPGCEYTVEEEAAFSIVLKKAFTDAGFGYIRVLGLDHNPNLADEALEELRLPNGFDGIAFHDYGGELSEMSKIKKEFPDTEVFFTERAVWGTYGANRILQYIRNDCCSYCSWVSMYDSNQEPNNSPYKGEGLGVAPAIRRAGSDSEYWFAPETYLMGQFAKFIDYGSYRIDSDYGEEKGLSTVAFRNTDGSLAIIAVNCADADEEAAFVISGEAQFKAVVPAQTVATFIIGK